MSAPGGGAVHLMTQSPASTCTAQQKAASQLPDDGQPRLRGERAEWEAAMEPGDAAAPRQFVTGLTLLIQKLLRLKRPGGADMGGGRVRTFLLQPQL